MVSYGTKFCGVSITIDFRFLESLRSWLSINVLFSPLVCYNPLAFAFVRWITEIQDISPARRGLEVGDLTSGKIVCHGGVMQRFYLR